MLGHEFQRILEVVVGMIFSSGRKSLLLSQHARSRRRKPHNKSGPLIRPVNTHSQRL